MQIIQVTDEYKSHWDSFVKTNAADGGLLQSWGWGDFQKVLGNKVYRFAAVNGGGKFQAAATVIKQEMPFEYNYLYCPRGPVIAEIDPIHLNSLFAEIKKTAREEKSFMIRIDPPWTAGSEKILTDLEFRKSEGEVQPRCSFIIDISSKPEEILARMKQKTRYNIGLAEKKGVKVRLSTELSDLEAFWQLTKQTAKRDGFNPHVKEHYKKMMEILSKDKSLELLIAEYDNKIIAANMIAFSGKYGVYLHGSSSDMYRKVMAPYLLQFKAILEARQRGCCFYDFGGVNGKSYVNTKWEGITRFKNGFDLNMEPKEYIGAYELIYNPFIFATYKFVKQLRD